MSEVIKEHCFTTFGNKRAHGLLEICGTATNRGGERGSFALKGSNFFERPEPGKLNEAAWETDKDLLDHEHRALRDAVRKILRTPNFEKLLPKLRRDLS